MLLIIKKLTYVNYKVAVDILTISVGLSVHHKAQSCLGINGSLNTGSYGRYNLDLRSILPVCIVTVILRRCLIRTGEIDE